jgi:hypothetical protein
MKPLPIALLFFTLIHGLSATAQTISSSWTSASQAGGSGAGTLGPLSVGATGVTDATLDTQDMTEVSFSAFPLAAAQPVLSFDQEANFQITFSQPVTGLMLYVGFWRIDTYTLNEDFTVLSGLAGTTKTGNSFATTNAFTSGIIRFNRPVKVLSGSALAGSGASQNLTFAVVKQPTLASVKGEDRVETNGFSVTLKGDCSATFSVKRVLIKNGSSRPKPAKLIKQGLGWRARVRLEPGTNRLKITALGFDNSKSKPAKVTVVRN